MDHTLHNRQLKFKLENRTRQKYLIKVKLGCIVEPTRCALECLTKLSIEKRCKIYVQQVEELSRKTPAE